MIWLEHYKEHPNGLVTYDYIYLNPVTMFPTRHKVKFDNKLEAMEYFAIVCRHFILWNIDQMRVTCKTRMIPFPNDKLDNLTRFDTGSLVAYLSVTVERLHFRDRNKVIEKRLYSQRDNANAGIKALRETLRKIFKMNEANDKNDAA